MASEGHINGLFKHALVGPHLKTPAMENVEKNYGNNLETMLVLNIIMIHIHGTFTDFLDSLLEKSSGKVAISLDRGRWLWVI